MPATSSCKPWCTDHQGADECYTSFSIHDDGREAERFDPESLAGQFAALGRFPGQVSWVSFVACQEDDDEHPAIDLQFFEAGADEMNCHLHLSLEELKDLHRNLGTAIRRLS